MIVVSAKKFKENHLAYLDKVDSGEELLVQRGKDKSYKIVPAGNEASGIREKNSKWAREFMAIPDEYRCNPFDVSPSGDLFFADKRNLDSINKGMKQIERGEGTRYTREEIRAKFGL
jgi:hypothetical protein